MKKINVLRIFLASPGDVKAEREMIFALKDDLDLLIGKDKNIKFEIINWERNTYPGKGIDAQDVINEQINDEYDVFIGIFWQRFGTPTNRYESGTLEEYENAKKKYENDKENTHIMMYFKTEGNQNIYDIDLEQLKKVKTFKDKISKEDGILYSEFEKTEDLKNLAQINLANLVRDKFSKKKRSVRKSAQQKKDINSSEITDVDKYELLAMKIDKGDYNVEIEIFLEDIEKTNSFLSDLASSTNKLTLVMNFFSTKTNERTRQLNRINNIKDERLRLTKAKKVSNDYADDLDKYSNDFEALLAEFRESISNSIQSYSEIIYKTINSNSFDENNKNELLENIPNFISSVETAIEGTADFLETFTKMSTHLTAKYSTSKRRAELATNNVFKELIRTKKLLKQLLDDNKD
ncbi:DUF4062 domain-containing protein [Chryseobacterium taiwanense]|uniref:DUF4062 domain-containing protein n=1 Tax=Chryseobacterium taiwanense TaxID=363331 RepID=UPI00068B614E|nr:DUF4062 domain-containing protein [Chryseobacterium taiwanense]